MLPPPLPSVILLCIPVPYILLSILSPFITLFPPFLFPFLSLCLLRLSEIILLFAFSFSSSLCVISLLLLLLLPVPYAHDILFFLSRFRLQLQQLRDFCHGGLGGGVVFLPSYCCCCFCRCKSSAAVLSAVTVPSVAAIPSGVPVSSSASNCFSCS